MSDNQSTYVPVDWLAKARALEAEENSFEAKKAYQRVSDQDPGNAEAAFFLAVYDAAQAQNSELSEQCGLASEKLTAAAEALRDSPDAAERFAPMARRAAGLANRTIRAAEYVRDHYASTNKRDLDMADRRRDSWCASAIGLLRTAEHCAAETPGAEGDLLSLRKASLSAVREHGAGLPEKQRRAEVQRLAAEIKKADPTADVGIPAAARLTQLKLPVMAALFAVSAAVLLYRLLACQTRLIGYDFTEQQAILHVAVVAVFDFLFFWTIRARDLRVEGYSARLCAGVFIGVQAALMLLTGSISSPISRGFAMPVDVLVIGLLLLYYAFRSPFARNWGSVLMAVVAVGFLTYSLAAMPTQAAYDEAFEVYAAEQELYGSIPLSAEQVAALESETIEAEDEANYLTEEQVAMINPDYQGKIEVRKLVQQQQLLTAIIEHKDEQIQINQTNYILNLISVFLSDLACAVGFLNLEGASKKKKETAKKAA